MTARGVVAFGLLALVVASAPACETSVPSESAPDATAGAVEAGTCQGQLKELAGQVGNIVANASGGCTTVADCTLVDEELLPCFEGCPVAVPKAKAGDVLASFASLAATCPKGCGEFASCAGGALVCVGGHCGVDIDGTGVPDGAVPTCPNAPVPTKADLDQPDGAPGWNPPKPRQTTACSASDLSRFATNLANQGWQRWDDLVAGLPTSCAQCILSRETDANWQLVVTNATGTNGFIDWGACYADAPHGSAACGQAVQYLDLCIDVACNGCSSQADFDACTRDKTMTSECEANFGQTLTSACDQAHAQELDDQCGQLVNAAAIVCGDGTLPDGGKLTD